MPELTMAWSEGWLWLSGSLFLAVFGANLAWFFRQPRSGMVVDEFVIPLIAWRFSPWLLELLRLLYYIGVPFAALLWGHDAVVGRLLGLQHLNWPTLSDGVTGAAVTANWLDWAYDVGWTAALGIGVWTLLALGWWAYRRALISTDAGGTVSGIDASGWVLLREAAYHEVHWAFYRNVLIIAWSAYWGTWGGLALVGLEAALNPAWRKGLTNPQQAPAQLMRGALAVISGALSLLTQNLWLALALHWGVSWGLVVLVRTLPLRICQPEQAASREL